MAGNPEDIGDGAHGQASDFYEARLIGSLKELDALLRTSHLEVGCSHPHYESVESGTVALLVFATRAQLDELRGRGIKVEIGENVSQRAERLKQEIATGDRFEGGRVPPQGFGVIGRGRGQK